MQLNTPLLRNLGGDRLPNFVAYATKFGSTGVMVTMRDIDTVEVNHEPRCFPSRWIRAERLECGDLSPLLHGAWGEATVLESAPSQSGDKSPHSKR